MPHWAHGLHPLAAPSMGIVGTVIGGSAASRFSNWSYFRSPSTKELPPTDFIPKAHAALAGCSRF